MPPPPSQAPRAAVRHDPGGGQLPAAARLLHLLRAEGVHIWQGRKRRQAEMLKASQGLALCQSNLYVSVDNRGRAAKVGFVSQVVVRQLHCCFEISEKCLAMTKCLHFPVAAPRWRREGGHRTQPPRSGLPPWAPHHHGQGALAVARPPGSGAGGGGALGAGAARAGAGGLAVLLVVAETCRCFWRRGWGSTKRQLLTHLPTLGFLGFFFFLVIS